MDCRVWVGRHLPADGTPLLSLRLSRRPRGKGQAGASRSKAQFYAFRLGKSFFFLFFSVFAVSKHS